MGSDNLVVPEMLESSRAYDLKISELEETRRQRDREYRTRLASLVAIVVLGLGVLGIIMFFSVEGQRHKYTHAERVLEHDIELYRKRHADMLAEQQYLREALEGVLDEVREERASRKAPTLPIRVTQP